MNSSLSRFLIIVALALISALAGCQAHRETGINTPSNAPCGWVVSGESPNHRFGYAVGAAGDVNGDGFDDVIVGADQYKQFTGRVYVYLGSPTGLDSSPAFVGAGETVNNHYGYAAGTAGDVNGDGFDDIIVAAYHRANFQGRAYVYLGSSSGLRAASIVLDGEGPGDYFGRSVATAGDVNGDGYDDLIIGAQAYERNTGRAYLYTGSPTGLSTSPASIVTGEGLSDSFGQSVRPAGDVDGDGYGDVIVGAHGFQNGTGRAYVYGGDSNGLKAEPIFVTTGSDEGARHGFAVGTAGDLNGDGYSDILVGAYGEGKGTGSVYVYAGGPAGLDARPIFSATGKVAGDWFGHAVGTAGDVDGDGYDDIIIGARRHHGNTGQVYLYAGSALGLDATPMFIFDGQEYNDWFGHSVGTAGDIDGDGRAEVIAGAYGYGESTGRAYVPCTP